jgi:hypothetical protein
MTMADIDAQELADRYIAAWTRTDVKERRTAVEDLWAPGGLHVVRPPEEVREAAATRGFDTADWRAAGHDAIERRVARSFATYVADGRHTFRARRDAVRLGRVVTFTWEMVPTAGGDAAGGGTEFLVLGEDGRIAEDYMFPGL